MGSLEGSQQSISFETTGMTQLGNVGSDRWSSYSNWEMWEAITGACNPTGKCEKHSLELAFKLGNVGNHCWSSQSNWELWEAIAGARTLLLDDFSQDNQGDHVQFERRGSLLEET